MNDEILIQFAEVMGYSAGRWQSGINEGRLYIDDSEGIDRKDELRAIIGAVAQACAKVCDERAVEMDGLTEEHSASQDCAARIRAKFA